MPHERTNRDPAFRRHRVALCGIGVPGWLQDCASFFSDVIIGNIIIGNIIIGNFIIGRNDR